MRFFNFPIKKKKITKISKSTTDIVQSTVKQTWLQQTNQNLLVKKQMKNIPCIMWKKNRLRIRRYQNS